MKRIEVFNLNYDIWGDFQDDVSYWVRADAFHNLEEASALWWLGQFMPRIPIPKEYVSWNYEVSS
jgi:hypothetical protein